MKRKTEMKNKPRSGTATGTTGFGMKTTINKSLLIKTIAAISTHAPQRVTSAKTCNQKHLPHTHMWRMENISGTHILNTASAVKQSERTTKKKQFHVMMKTLFTSSSGSDSISCGIPRCIAGEEKDDRMESREVIVSGGWKQNSGDENGAAKTTKAIRKNLRLIKIKSNIRKAKAK